MIAILVISLLVLLLIGVPIAFCLAISATLYLMTSGDIPLIIIGTKLVQGSASFTRMALPLFIFSGAVLAYGCTPRLMKMVNMLIGKVPGGVGGVGIATCGLFGTISGSGIATVAAVGGVIMPEMVNQGYKKSYVASIISAAGTLGGIIPPSICLVIYATVANVSIGTMLLAGVGPGVFAVIVLMIYNGIKAKVCHYGKPDETVYSLRDKCKIILDAIPSLMMPIIILGGSMSGIITATESAAIATVYAILLACPIYRELNVKQMFEVAVKGAISASTLMFICSCAAPFGWVLTMANIPNIVANAILAMNASPLVIYGAILLILIFMGMFLDTIVIITIAVPIMLPIVGGLGMHAVQFGAIIGIAACIGCITPPLATCLFTGCRVIDIKVEESFPEILEVIAVFILILIAVTAIPQISLWIPGLL